MLKKDGNLNHDIIIWNHNKIVINYNSAQCCVYNQTKLSIIKQPLNKRFHVKDKKNLGMCRSGGKTTSYTDVIK